MLRGSLALRLVHETRAEMGYMANYISLYHLLHLSVLCYGEPGLRLEQGYKRHHVSALHGKGTFAGLLEIIGKSSLRFCSEAGAAGDSAIQISKFTKCQSLNQGAKAGMA